MNEASAKEQIRNKELRESLLDPELSEYTYAVTRAEEKRSASEGTI